MCVILSVYAKIPSFSVKKCSDHSDVMHERRLTPPHVRRHFLPRPVSQKFRSVMQEKVFHDFYPFWIISVSQEGCKTASCMMPERHR